MTGHACGKTPEHGFTLIELMVSIGILTVVLGGVVVLLQKGQLIFKTEQNMLGSIQDTRAAFDSMTSEIMLAGSGQVANYGIVAGNAGSITVRGNFDSVSTIVLSLNAASGVMVVGSTAGFTTGQTVALSRPDAGIAIWTTIIAVNPAALSLTVSTTTTPLTSGSVLSDFGPGAMVDVINRVKYEIDGSGNITRTVSPELNPSAGTPSILAEGVLDSGGNPGLTVMYASADGMVIEPPINSSNSADVELITLTLKARMTEKDSQTGSYRNYALKTYVRPRNQ